MWWFADRRMIRGVTGAPPGNIPIGPPVRMVIMQQPPTGAISGSVLSTSPVVGFQDIYGNIVPNAGANVTAAPSVGTMSGTLVVAADASLGAATFANLIFDDIANAMMSSRTITFSCPGFANVVSNAVLVNKASLKFWVEADFGVVDANGAAMTTWADRSPSGANVSPAPTKSAPIFRSSGFGGIAGLPYWDFLNSHAAKTAMLAALRVTTTTEFYVFQRDPADANCAIALLLSDTIDQGIQDSAASAYASRWNAGHTILLESSYSVGTWLPKGSRQIVRQEMGGTHATHKVFLNGAQQLLADQFVNNPGAVQSSDVEVHLGYRDVALPGFDLLGQIAAALVFTPALNATEITAVEAYLAKWLAAGPAVPISGHGPILFASQVIDGVTVTVSGWHSSGTPDFASSDYQYGRLVFTFSEPIKRFRATLVFGQTAPIPWYRLIQGVNNLTGPWSYDIVPGAGGAYSPGINNQTVQINDTVTGFTSVITQLAPISGAGFSPMSVFKDCYFSKMSDP